MRIAGSWCRHFGGDALLPYSERMFCADSEAVLAALVLEDREHPYWRGHFAVKSVRRLLKDWGFAAVDAAAFCRTGADMLVPFIETHDTGARRRIAAHCRRERARLDRFASDAHTTEPPSERRIADALEVRSACVQSCVSVLRDHVTDGDWHGLRDRLLRSHLHMHVNRVFKDRHRYAEYALYEWMARGLAMEHGRGFA